MLVTLEECREERSYATLLLVRQCQLQVSFSSCLRVSDSVSSCLFFTMESLFLTLAPAFTQSCKTKYVPCCFLLLASKHRKGKQSQCLTCAVLLSIERAWKVRVSHCMDLQYSGPLHRNVCSLHSVLLLSTDLIAYSQAYPLVGI